MKLLFSAEIITETVGYLAAVFGTYQMIPQVYKSYMTKKVNDISKVMVVVYIINCSLWEVYGLLIHSWPIILCNFIALIIGIIQIGLKLKYQSEGN